MHMHNTLAESRLSSYKQKDTILNSIQNRRRNKRNVLLPIGWTRPRRGARAARLLRVYRMLATSTNPA